MAGKGKGAATKNWWQNLPADRQHLILLLFLFLTPFFVFPEVVFEAKKFFAHDIIQWRSGSDSIIEYREKTGKEPLWAQNMFSGMPAYLVSYQKAVPHVDLFIRNLFEGIFPISIFWTLLAGVYVMGCTLSFSRIAAAFTAISIGFTTYLPVIVGAGHNSKLIAFSWVPWMIAGLIWTLKSKKPFLPALAFSIALTLQVRANHPQVTYYFLFLALALGLKWLYDEYQSGFKQQSYRKIALLAAAVLLAVLANVQPYWSTLEYSPYSIRGGSALEQSSGLDQGYAMAWSQGWTELWTLIFPNFLGGSSSMAYWGPKSVTSGPHYLGALTIILFIFSFFGKKNTFRISFLVGGILGVFFSLGDNFMLLNGLMFDYFPMFNKFRTPEMWLILSVFCFSVLAGSGLDSILQMHINEKKFRLGLAVVAGLFLLGWLSSSALLSYEKTGERSMIAQQVAAQNGVSPANPQVQQVVSRYLNQQLIPDRKKLAGQEIVRFFIFAILSLGLLYGFFRWPERSIYLALALLILNFTDMSQVGRRYLNTESMLDKQYSPEQAINRMKRDVDVWIQDRVATPQNWEYRVFPTDTNPFNSAVTSAFYPSIGGYSGAKLSIYQDLVEEALYSEQGFNNVVLDMLNVKYLTLRSPLNLEGYKVVFRGQSSVVLQNLDVKPKAFFADSLIYAESAREAMNELKSLTSASTAIIESSKPSQPKADAQREVEVISYGPREIELKTQSSTSSFLILSEIFYPAGWKAYIDGSEVPVHKTNYVLRGIEVPGGEHDVVFAFNPASHILGSTLAWVGNLIQLLLLVPAAMHYRKSDNAE